MSIILPPERWKRVSQPQVSAVLDNNLPFVEHAKALVLGNLGGFDCLKQRLATRFGNVVEESTTAGIGSNGYTLASAPTDTGTKDFTDLCVAYIPTNPSATGIKFICGNDPLSFANYGLIGADFSSSKILYYYDDGYATLEIPIDRFNRTHTIAVTRKGTTLGISANGSYSALAIRAGATHRVDSTQDRWIHGGAFTTILGDGTSNPYRFPYPVLLSGRSHVYTPPDELKELTANPWQVFKPTPRRTYIDLGANSVNEKKPATPRQSFLLGTTQPGPKPSVAPLILRDWKQHIPSSNQISQANLQSSLSQTLVFLTNASTYNHNLNLISETKATTPGVSTLSYGSGSAGSEYSSISTKYSGTVMGGTKSVSWFAVLRSKGTVSSLKSVFRNDGSVTPAQFNGTTNILQCVIWLPSVTSVQYGTVTPNVITVVSGDYTTDIGGSLHLNGKIVANLPSTLSESVSTTSNPVCIGGTEGNGEMSTNVEILATAFWRSNGYTPKFGELKQLHENPWQLFEPRKERIFVGV